MPLTRVPVRREAVASAKSGEQTPIPAIGKAKTHFDTLFDSFGGAERGANPVDCGGRGISLSWRCGTFKEGCNLPQLLTKFLFSGQILSFSFPEQTWPNVLRTSRILQFRRAFEPSERRVVVGRLTGEHQPHQHIRSEIVVNHFLRQSSQHRNPLPRIELGRGQIGRD